MPHPPDILIAGAGPAGSATAVHLARAGYRVLLVDRAAFPREKPCSEYLSPEAVRHLADLGVLATLERDGAQPLFGTRVLGPRGARLEGRFSEAAVRPFRDAGLALPRRILDQRLVEAAVAAGATLCERTMVEELLHDGGGVAGAVLREASGARRAVHARLVIGADGLRSVVARRIAASRRGSRGAGALLRQLDPGAPVAGAALRPHGQAPWLSRLAFVAHVEDVPGLDGFAEMHVSDAGYVGLNRIGPGLANVALVVPAALGARARGRVDSWMFDELERFPGVRGRVDRRRVTRRVLATGPFAYRARRVISDGALLVGDAADFFDPFTGEGITSALRGARLAADVTDRALADGGPATAARLAPYLAARRAAFLGKWTVERLVGYGMIVPRLFDRAVAQLERRGLAHTFIGVTGDYVPASAVLNPWFLARMVL